MNLYLHGVFKDEHRAVAAQNLLQTAGVDSDLLSPYPLHETHPDNGRSAVRWYSLFGGIFGFGAGVFLTIYSATHYLLPTGGRPIITFPPFLLVSYELTILFAVLATLIGFLRCSGLPAWRDRPHCQAASVESIVVTANVRPDQVEHVRAQLLSQGAYLVEEQRIAPEELS